MLYQIFYDDESLLPLFLSPITSLRNLANMIGSRPYIQLILHTVDTMPLSECIEACRREALEPQKKFILKSTTLALNKSEEEDFLNHSDYMLVL